MTETCQYTNHLAGETSPYLLQHLHNPVDWHPWGPEALRLARELDRPILLSIGYSACHWCHVMAHECFEDEEVAGVMNELFVNIKVDREERPDLDRVYQAAHHLLNQRPGGWPLTVFLTPDDHIPFFCGTYFPKAPRHNLPGFVELMRRIHAFYRERQDDIRAQNASVAQALRQLAAPPPAEGEPQAQVLGLSRDQLAQQFDARFGGFGSAPKFPHPTSLDRLLRHWARSRASGKTDDGALHMVEDSLMQMARGGLYDQLGGGFFRYSVDERWEIPHFEKMLYDNAALLTLYADAHAATGQPLFARVARETASWVMREMQAPEGGYYSALDADSEGEEGRFYVWDRNEVRAILGEEDYPLAAARFGLEGPANFEGRWHLTARVSTSELADRFGLSREEAQARLARIRARLFEARAARVPPGLDDKVLTAWNALIIRGMARAARVLGEASWGTSAEAAFDFLRRTHWRNGRLLATSRDGKARLPAYLDDHAFLIDAALELLQLRWRSEDLDFALALADLMLEHFEDQENGGFFFTADDHERLIQRAKPVHDEALPAGNGVALRVLLRLGRLLGEPRYLEAAERGLRAFWGAMRQNPHACPSLLDALEEWLFPGETLILRGDPQAFAGWADRGYAPARMRFVIPADCGDLPPALADKKAGSTPLAYLCRGTTCSAPADSAETLHTLLRQQLP